MKISLLQKMILGSILIVTTNVLLGYSIYMNNQNINDTYQLLKKSEEVVKHSNLILSRIMDVETAARGYVISKDLVFLEPLNNAKSKMLLSLNQLKFLTVYNPSQRRRVDSLGSYIDKRLVVSSHMIDLRNKEGLNAAVDYVSSRIGKNCTDSIRKITNSINEEERFIQKQQLKSDEQNEVENDRLAMSLFLLMSFFTILLLIVTVNYLYQNKIKLLRATELINANKDLKFQNIEKGKRDEELLIANLELAFQNKEKRKRSEELSIANVELAFQNEEKSKRAEELLIANVELAFQNEEKSKRAEELSIANVELAFQNEEKSKRAEELLIANVELAFQNEEKGKRAEELAVANIELAFQNGEKEKRAGELAIANIELATANIELAFQNNEKEKRAEELAIANIELAFQNEEKSKRAEELSIANVELAFQNEEKSKRAEELLIANVELAFQNEEKGKRAEELSIANVELAFQNEEKSKRAEELLIANKELTNAKVYLKRYIKGLEELINMTSHKVRLPIANILGLADALQDSQSSPLELKQIIIYIKESALKLDVFTKELTVYMVNLNQKKK